MITLMDDMSLTPIYADVTRALGFSLETVDEGIDIHDGPDTYPTARPRMSKRERHKLAQRQNRIMAAVEVGRNVS